MANLLGLRRAASFDLAPRMNAFCGASRALGIEELNDGSNEFLWWTTGLAPSDGYLFDPGAPIAFPPSPLHKL